MTDYNLPDNTLLRSKEHSGFLIFRPDKNYLILGRSNNAEDSTHTDLAKEDNISILQRPSGGEAVLLSPKTMVISIKMPTIKGKNPLFYFSKANTVIIHCLEKHGVQNLHTKGISDISIENRKILGSSIYKTQNSMFYHAVLNLSEDTCLIAKYLKHPKKEPDYRKGRKHTEFITSLKNEGYNINYKTLNFCLSEVLSNTFFTNFASN